MEFLRFIKWQWNRVHRDDKIGTFIILSTIICMASLWFTGSTIIVILGLGGLVTFSGGVILWIIHDQIKSRWNLYKSIKEREAEEILRKLRGNNNPFPNTDPTRR